MFGRKVEPIVVTKVLEVERPAALPDIDHETLATLQHHPGMLYLLAKLRLQKAYLDNKLRYECQPDLRSYDMLQAGIFWASWLERQLEQELTLKKAPPRLADPSELDTFSQVSDQLTLVGRTEG